MISGTKAQRSGLRVVSRRIPNSEFRIPRVHENSRLPKRVRLILPTVLFWIFAPIIHWLLLIWGKKPPHGLLNLDEAERLAKERGVGILFVANHANEVDPFVVGTSMHWRKQYVPTYAVSRVKERYRHYGVASVLFGGRLFWSFGTYPVLQGLRNYKQSVPFHEEVLLQKRAVLIFIEGAILDEPLSVAKGGAGYLTCATGAIVVPVALCGTANLPPRLLFSGKRKFFASFGKPLLPETLTKGSPEDPQACKDGSARIMDALRSLLVIEGYALKQSDGSYKYVLP